jgi:hypothetical protein
MFKKCWIGCKERIKYGREILNEIAATSGKVGGWLSAVASILKWLILLTPVGVAAAIGEKAKWSLEDWIKKPSEGLLFWFCFLALMAAFNKHKKQQTIIEAYDNAKIPKLEILDVVYHRPASGDDACSVSIKNLSKTTKAENVHVIISGKLIQGVLKEGFNPFFEPDCIPTSGVRTINADSPAHFKFPEKFMTLLNGIEALMTMGNYGKHGKQVFTVTASSADSAATSAVFSIERDQTQPYFGMSFVKQLP